MLKDVKIDSTDSLFAEPIINLKQINLIVGKNGTGKSYFLSQLFSHKIKNEHYVVEIKTTYSYDFIDILRKRIYSHYVFTHSKYEGCLIVLDNIGNDIHFSLLKDMWDELIDLIKDDKQIFATTHSWDIIRALYYSAREKDMLDNVNLMRFQKGKDGKIYAIYYDKDNFKTCVLSNIECR